FYLLNRMAIDFFEQFDRYMFEKVRQSDLSAVEYRQSISACLYEFGLLYQLVQQFKVYMRRYFDTLAFCLLTLCAVLWYLVFYTDFKVYFKPLILIAIVNYVTVLTYFAAYSGRIDIVARKMSDKLYRRFNVEETKFSSVLRNP